MGGRHQDSTRGQTAPHFAIPPSRSNIISGVILVGARTIPDWTPSIPSPNASRRSLHEDKAPRGDATLLWSDARVPQDAAGPGGHWSQVRPPTTLRPHPTNTPLHPRSRNITHPAHRWCLLRRQCGQVTASRRKFRPPWPVSPMSGPPHVAQSPTSGHRLRSCAAPDRRDFFLACWGPRMSPAPAHTEDPAGPPELSSCVSAHRLIRGAIAPTGDGIAGWAKIGIIQLKCRRVQCGH